jgi:hypothetical protein
VASGNITLNSAEALLITERLQAKSKINWLRGDRVALELAIDLAVGRPLVIVLAAELEPEIGLVVVERVLVPVAAEQEHDQAVVELEQGPVVADPEHAQAVAVLARGHPHAQLEVLVEAKSVIVMRHRALARLAVEDLAAVVAATSLEPAAAGAVTAWEVAGSVAAEAGVAVGDAVAAADVAAVADKSP